jgi:hypothetical protein
MTLFVVRKSIFYARFVLDVKCWGVFRILGFLSAMNVVISWNITPCIPYVNRLFVAKDHVRLQVTKSANQQTSDQQVDKQLLTYHEPDKSQPLHPMYTTLFSTSSPMFFLLERLSCVQNSHRL